MGLQAITYGQENSPTGADQSIILSQPLNGIKRLSKVGTTLFHSKPPLKSLKSHSQYSLPDSTMKTFSGGSALYCETIQDADFVQGNIRFRENFEEGAETKIWKKEMDLGDERVIRRKHLYRGNQRYEGERPIREKVMGNRIE